MSDNPRIEDLRRRVQKDPASIAFAQLAEEYRRAGQHKESVEVCRAGLSVHPGYLSARVTLGRALVEVGQLDDAQHELETVLKSASENLAAIRGLAEIHHRRGALTEALAYYRSALTLARNDPELQQTVEDLTRQVEPSRPAKPEDGLSLEQMQREMVECMPPSPSQVDLAPPPPPGPVETAAAPPPVFELPVFAPSAHAVALPALPAAPVHLELAPPKPDPERDRAVHTVAALEEWLTAIHAARSDRQS
jgi:tetratricopeptide (TPR) repeat protein